MAVKAISKTCRKNRNSRGITLVELIVVLVVMAIVAGAGIGSSIGYLKRSEFNQNQSNAETIYTAVQTALLQADKSGTIDNLVQKRILKVATPYAWAADNQSSNMLLEKEFNKAKFDNFNVDTPAKPNDSVHMRYLLTYRSNPTSETTDEQKQKELLRDIIQPYFYDASIFVGTMCIELDVEKTKDAYENIHYSARCLSVFVNSRDKAGWSEKAFDSTNQYKVVPTRSADYRQNTSRIGYYDGYKISTEIDTVYLPKLKDGIQVTKLAYDLTTETTTVNNNGVDEQVDETHNWISWSAMNDGENLIGAGNAVYYRFALKGTNSCILILNEDFLLWDNAVGDAHHAVDYKDLKDQVDGATWKGSTVTVEKYDVQYSDKVEEHHEIKKTSITVLAQVYYKSGTSDSYKSLSKTAIKEGFIKVPLKISYVEHEYEFNKQGVLEEKDPYYEYSLKLTEAKDVSGNPVNLINGVNEATITIYPNYFSDGTMNKVNDDTGIIPLKKGKKVEFEQGTDP